MTDRLAVATAIVSGIALSGLAVKSVAAAWHRRILGTQTLPLDDEGSPRLLLFTGKQCGTCLRQKHEIEQLQAEWLGPLKVTYVDAASQPDLSRQFGVMMVPTTVIARGDGSLVGVTSGLVRKDRILLQLTTLETPDHDRHIDHPRAAGITAGTLRA